MNFFLQNRWLQSTKTLDNFSKIRNLIFFGLKIPVTELSITRKLVMQILQKKIPLTVRTFCYKYTKFCDISITSFLVMDSSVTGIFNPKKMRFRILEILWWGFVFWKNYLRFLLFGAIEISHPNFKPTLNNWCSFWQYT